MNRNRSISVPITLGSASVALCILVLVGWVLVIAQNLEVTERFTENVWWLVFGIFSLAAIITVLVLFSVFLVRETLEVRRQTSFIDSVTHELKSPLTSLSMGLQTLERPDLAEAHKEQVRLMMQRDVERLSVFIEDVLEASRIDHGFRGMGVSEFPLDHLLARAIETITRRYDLPDDAIRTALPGSMILYTDATALETVLKNLLDNAVKYSDGPVRVQVETELGPKELWIRVSDQGIGIPEGMVGRVTDRFFRVPNESVRRRPGTGLGLYVVNALVRSLGGRLSAHSEGPGKGTTMTVTLPRSAIRSLGKAVGSEPKAVAS